MSSRRHFLHASAGLAAAYLSGCGIKSCGSTTVAGKPSLTFAPMSAEVTESTAVLWARTSAEATVQFEYATERSFANSARTPETRVSADTDFVHTAQISGLTPATRYFFRAVAKNGNEPVVGDPGELTTAPVTAASCRFVWSADLLASYMPFKILDAMTAAKPDVFLMLGDATYANHPIKDPAKDLAGFRQKHRDIRQSPELQRLLASTSTYGTWDDHDCTNDTDRTHPLMVPARQAFREFWPVRSAPGAGEGLYRTYRWGALVEIFMLDCRTFRDPKTDPNVPGKAMLGSVQKEWLKASLKASAAPFKLIVSSVPFLAPFEDDSWFGYAAERDELKAFFKSEVKGKITILSADFHMAWHLEDAEHGLHEFIVGPVGAWPFQQIKRPFVQQVKESGRFFIMNANNYGDAGGDKPPALAVSVHDVAGVQKYRANCA
jgi:alkaline phosphatase D